MKNILITENQLKLISEALGVPDNILDAAEEVFDIFADNLKKIKYKNEEYHFDGELNIELGDRKKIKINNYELTVTVEEYDQVTGKPQIISMGMMQNFKFDREAMMKKIDISTTAEFEMDFAVKEGWEPHELYETLMSEKDQHLSSLAHELKHKYDKQAKEFDLIGRDAEYQATHRYGSFGIPVIDHKFFRFMYYTSIAENLVRQTEVASEMRSKNITKSQFREFLQNHRVYKELLEIKNFTFDKLIEGLKDSMDRVDALLEHVDLNPSEMTENEKIEKVLDLVYVNLANTRLETFSKMIANKEDAVKDLLRNLGLSLPSFMDDDLEEKKRMDNMIRKFQNYVVKYQDNPIEFFKNECENFNYVATKILKRISKLYAMAKDDNQPVSESIINWELHQQLMEKKFGKRKIDTEYNFKK